MYIFAIEGLTPSHPSRWTFEEENELLSCLLLLLRLRTRRSIRNSLPISMSMYERLAGRTQLQVLKVSKSFEYLNNI